LEVGVKTNHFGKTSQADRYGANERMGGNQDQRRPVISNADVINGSTRLNLLLAIGSVLVCLVVLDVAIRVVSRRDEDGNRWIRWTRLKPYHLPVKRVTRLVEAYQTAQSRAIIYDHELGWSPQPGRNRNNAPGFYSTRPDPDPAQPTDRLRIALFGASYTACSFEAGWWRTLDKTLIDAGVEAEVLNFGVAGYGIDQAYLRWRKHGAAYHPHIVIYGFNGQNCGNNLNLLRMLNEPLTGVPFMKPRFLLDGGQLKLINTPTPTPEELPGIVARFSEWPLAQHEHYFSPKDFQNNLWRHSWLLAFAEAQIEKVRQRTARASFYREDGEASRLTLKIIGQFKQEVEAAGSRFYVLNLPSEPELRALRETGSYPFAGLFTRLNQDATVINPDQAMLEVAHGQDLARFFFDGHYTDTNEFPRVVGTIVGKALLASSDVERYREKK
jgi:hypothetical protein